MVAESDRRGRLMFTESCGAVFIAPLDQITDPDHPQYTGLQFTRQGADGFTLGQLRDMIVGEGWLSKRGDALTAHLNIGQPCNGCGNDLTEDDMLNSLYGTHYTMCRNCASKISV